MVPVSITVALVIPGPRFQCQKWCTIVMITIED